ncbi:MAG TPA: 4Fe-4S dicluster domain-containing protein, partial [Gemmatimonadaceae bacterium]|nr:4Fe-4S dicluster domain-containing protein [Gemmatimonadaceae bacterium]
MSAPTVVPPECALPNSPLAGERSGIDACVHCGFCLQSCPTYLTLEDENDSPRGRIVLMRALLEGTLPPESESVHRHIAQCLGCRACETACPSGVPYGHLLEATRATLAEHRPIPFVARIILSVFERPRLLA